MSFINTFIDFEKIPTKAYLHSAGINNYGDTRGKQIITAMDYVKDVKNSGGFSDIIEKENLEYTLAAIWADRDEKVIDFFGFGDAIDNWPGNPEVKSWVFRNGIFFRGGSTCGDTLIMLGEEEKIRRKTQNLQDYFEKS